MAKKRKKQHHEEHVDESWLIPYADILTLLLALFIVLFASSTADEKKLAQMSEVFNSVFENGDGILEESMPPTVPEAEAKAPSLYTEDQQELAEIQKTVEGYIEAEKLENQFDVRLTPEGLLITIRDSVLFEPGEAVVKEEYHKLALDVSELLEFDPPRSVTVTGHTDNVPMNSEEFASNWDLSVMRSVNFLKLVIGNEKLDPRWFSAKGYGEFNPIASNDTAEGRAKNRRVEILVLPRVAVDGTVQETPQ